MPQGRQSVCFLTTIGKSFCYEPDKALILQDGVLKEQRLCSGCWEVLEEDEAASVATGMGDNEILRSMHLIEK